MSPSSDRLDETVVQATDDSSPNATWIILPTYNEMENLPGISSAILAALPGCTSSSWSTTARPTAPVGMADRLAAANDPRIRVRHRKAKQGLGRCLPRRVRRRARGRRRRGRPDGRRLLARSGRAAVARSGPILDGAADLVLGSRYVHRGGHRRRLGLARRRLISALVEALFARTVLRPGAHTTSPAGFKALARRRP